MNAQLEPLRYSAGLLTALTRTNVTEDELKKNSKDAKKALEGILKISKKDEDGEFSYKGKVYRLTVRLSDIAKKKVKDSLKLLAAGGALMVPKRMPRIRF